MDNLNEIGPEVVRQRVSSHLREAADHISERVPEIAIFNITMALKELGALALHDYSDPFLIYGELADLCNAADEAADLAYTAKEKAKG